MFTVRGYCLPRITCPFSKQPLYPHQVAMWENWLRYNTILLAAKTGCGKTRAAMLPLLRRRECAVAVYPTNELAKDQLRAVTRFALDEGKEPFVLVPDVWDLPDRVERYSRATHILVPINRAILDEWQTVLGCKSRGETLRRLLDPDKPKVVFTNPDILFLILGLKYHAEPFAALARYTTLIVDEFHLYQGVELAHALIMIVLARGFGIFQRVILLSATPHDDVRALLDTTISPVPIQFDEVGCAGQADLHVAVHPVDVMPIQVVGTDPTEILLSQIMELKPQLERLRTETPHEGYIPAVVIVNSVVSAIHLEDRLVDNGFSRDSLAIIRGLSHRAIRATGNKLLALGTSAIEVGVDFHCDYLLFEASEAASFLQRFGRVGRHRRGKAIVLVPPSAFAGMVNLVQEVDRAQFEERVYCWYPSLSSHPWFVTTEHGMITARALAENLISTVQKDASTRPEFITQLRGRIEAILAAYADTLGCRIQNQQAKTAFERAAAGKKNMCWVNTYRKLERFRTSLPTVKVRDFMEQHRRQEWEMGEYEVDISTLLKRGVGITWNEKLKMLTIRGIGKYRKVHASEIFRDEDCFQLLETKDYPLLRLYQDSESTPVSDLMGRENHIFVVVPKAVVEHEIDWRLPVFEAGKYLIAFDGAALLLLEMAKRLVDLGSHSR